jgi:hypothetical protein
MRKILSLLALGVFAMSMQAGTLLPGTFPNPDTGFTATFDVSVPSVTLATPGGPDTLFVFDDLSNFLGNVIASDQGTPGQLIVTINGALSEEVALMFNTAGASIDGSGNLIIPVSGVPATTITDPGLAALLGNSTFTFASAGTPQNPFVFDFSSAALPATATPEPAVSLSIGFGLLAITALRRRKRSS